jgi:uncharacterized protein
VPQDLAANQGYALAQYGLGFMYTNGQGVPQDYVEAVKWYRLAAEQGHAVAQGSLDRLAARMPPAQIAEARRLASEWKPTR